MRIQFITNSLACGGAINDKGAFNTTMSHGITHIINLDKTCYGADKVETLHYRIKDNGHSRPDRFILCCLIFALEVLKDPNNKLFIHCAAGRRRSTSICYGVLRCLGHSSKESESIIVKRYFEPLEKRDVGYRRPSSVIKYRDDIERVLSNYNFLTA